MSSLSACFKIHGTPDREQAAIREMVQDHKDNGSSSPAIDAVMEMIQIAEARRVDVVGRIEAAGGTATAAKDYGNLLSDAKGSKIKESGGVTDGKLSGQSTVVSEGEQEAGVVQDDQGGKPAGVPGRGAGAVRGAGDDDLRADGRDPAGEDAGAGETAAPVPVDGSGDDKQRPVRIPSQPVNYRITDADSLGKGGAKAKAKANIKAIKILKKLRESGRPASPEQQAALVKYVGWGASELANGVFPVKKWDRAIGQYVETYKEGWEEIGKEVKELLSKEDYAEAQGSTLNAHYTSQTVISAMYRALERFGYDGKGRILEPGSGIGNFMGLLPDSFLQSRFTAVEMDSTTAGIAKLLYPHHDIRNADFAEFKAPNDFFDIAIGNPPFLDVAVTNDPDYAKNKFLIHDFFFAKSIDKVRPGGLMMLVTSKGTMDKASDKARAYLSKRADLIGAVRLPQTAFKENAGTEVVTDVIFLRKRKQGEEYAGESWSSLAEVKTKAGESVWVNEYYKSHPEMVLGHHSTAGSMYGPNQYTVEAKKEPIGDLFDAAVKLLPENIYQKDIAKTPTAEETIEAEFSPTETKEGGFYLSGDNIFQKEQGVGKPISAIGIKKRLLIDYITVRDAVRKVLYVQMRNDGGSLVDAQAELDEAYEGFVKRHGAINKSKRYVRTLKDGSESETYRLLNFSYFKSDPDAYLVASIERYNNETHVATKADIFTERVISPTVEPNIDTVVDALHVSLYRTGGVDIEMIAREMNATVDEVVSGLDNLIFMDPVGKRWVVQDEYLSGNVREKLAAAKAAVEIDKAFERNVKALEEVQPEDLPQSRIKIKLGMPLLEPEIIAGFAQSVIEMQIDASYLPLDGSWKIEARSGHRAAAAVSDYGTARAPADTLLELALNGGSPKIYDRDSDGNAILNKDATQAAIEKMEKIGARFSEWVWEDAKLAEYLARRFNDVYNNTVKREYGGEYIEKMQFPGLSTVKKPFEHQKRVAWRIIQRGNTYMAHSVGAGKTIASIIAGMELKRLGIKKKPTWVVPNHMLKQFSGEFLELYPAAKILVADEEQFAAENRNRFMGRVAAENWDAIIITHSAFKLIPMSAEFQKQFIDEQLAELEELLQEAQGDRMKRKQLERYKKRLEARLLKVMSNATKDKGVSFEETGIDQIFVDESQEFRKLEFTTNQVNVKGIDPAGSLKAFDLYAKSRYLETLYPGRSLVLMSGTPVTNTLGEIYSIQRFLQEPKLRELGIHHFDSWAATFGRMKTEIEPTPAGTYKSVSRFNDFSNLKALCTMWGEIGDFVHARDLPYLTRPKVLGGGRKLVIGEISNIQRDYKKELADRIKEIEKRKGPPQKGDDIILTVITDGRHAAMDDRYIDPAAPERNDSKMYKLIENATEIWKRTAGERGTQMIFADLGVPGSEGKRGFSVYQHIKNQLMESGVPEKAIAFIQDFKKSDQKQKLFKEMNAGTVRFLIGSSVAMGTGVNAQKRLIALHHFDPDTYLPSNIEQREGRIVRQGNMNGVVELYAYVARGSYDETMWQFLETKQRFIDDFLAGNVSEDTASDIDGAADSFAEARAMSSDNPLAIELAGVQNELGKLESLHRSHVDDQKNLRYKRTAAELGSKSLQAAIAPLKDAISRRTPTKGDAFKMSIGKKEIGDRTKAGQELLDLFTKEIGDKESKARNKVIGRLGGFDLVVTRFSPAGGTVTLEVKMLDKQTEVATPVVSIGTENIDIMAPVGLVMRFENGLNDLDSRLDKIKLQIKNNDKQISDADDRIGNDFEYQEQLEAKRARHAEILAELQKDDEAAQGGNEDNDTGDNQEISYSEKEPDRADPVKLEVIGEATDERSKKDIGKLQRTIERIVIARNREDGGGRRGPGLLKPVQVLAEHEGVSRGIAGAFGKRIVFFSANGGPGDFNGAVLKKANPDVIYINVSNEYLPLTVLGHELVHTLQNDHPDLYDALKGVLTAGGVSNRVGLQEYIDAYNARLAKEGEPPADNGVIIEEMIGDFMGDNFADPAFWKAIASKGSVFERLVQAVVDFIDNAIKLITGKSPDLQSHKFFKNIVAARSAAAWAMAEYAKRQAGGVSSKKAGSADVSFSTKGMAVPLSIEHIEEVARGSIRFIKGEKPDSTFLDRIFSTPEYYFKKFAAAGRVLHAALLRRDIKFLKETEILGDFTEYVQKLRKTNKKAYEEANDYLIETDQAADGFRLKLNDIDEWVLIGPGGKPIETFTPEDDTAEAETKAEKDATKAMIKAEGVMLADMGYSKEAITAVRMSRELTNRGFDIMAADMRRIIAEAKENGLPDPFIGDGKLDEGGRYGVYAKGKSKPIALFASEQEANEMLDRAAKMISYIVVGSKAGPKDFMSELKANRWARNHGGTVSGQKRFDNLVVKKRTDADLRPLTVKAAMAQMGDLRGIYFPRIRESGEYVMIARKDGENPIRKSFDLPAIGDSHPTLQKVINSMTPIGREASALKLRGYTVTVEKDKSPAEDVFEATNLVTSLDAILQSSMSVVNKNDDMEVRASQHINSILTMQVADIFKSRGYLSSRLKRLSGDEIWEGYETDMGKAMIQYGKNVAAGTAKRDTARAMVLAFSGRDYSWAEYKAEVEDPSFAEYQTIVEERRISEQTQKNLFRDVRSFMIDILRNDEQADRIIGTLKGLAVLKFLGFRVSSAAVNMTNMVQGVPATLAAHTGESIPDSLGRVIAAATAYGKYRSGKGNLSAADRAIFQEISRRGWDEAQFNHEAASELRGKAGEAWNKFITASMYMFGAAEKANRAMTLMAAYKAVKTKNTTMDKDMVWELAKDISDRAHGIYGKETLPAWARGKYNPLRLTYTFQKFSHNYMLNLVDIGFTRRNYAAAAHLLLSPAIMAGAGASLATPVIMAAAGVLGIGGDDPEEKFYSWAADTMGTDAFARHGLVGGLTGINIKGSLQINMPFSGKAIGDYSIADMAGPSGGVVSDIGEGFAHLFKGEMAKGIELLLPTAFGSMSKAVRESSEGLTTGNYGSVFYGAEPLKATTADAVIRFLSFNPSRLSGIREKQWNEKQVAASYQAEKTEIYAQIKRLHLQKKPLTPEVLKDISSYNERVRGADRADVTAITPKGIRSMLKRAGKASKLERNRVVNEI